MAVICSIYRSIDLSKDLSIALPEWVMVGIRKMDIHAFHIQLSQPRTLQEEKH